jgi:hypothetical protein
MRLVLFAAVLLAMSACAPPPTGAKHGNGGAGGAADPACIRLMTRIVCVWVD